MSKENFKLFVQGHPELSKYVINKKVSWQQFYELYDLYGENNSVWDDYLIKQKTVSTSSNTTTKENSMTDLVKMIKKVDLDSVQKTVGNLQKTIGLLQDLGIGGAAGALASTKKPYEPRPMYKYFED